MTRKGVKYLKCSKNGELSVGSEIGLIVLHKKEHSILQRAVVFATGSVFVSAAVEDVVTECVDRSVTLRTHGNLDFGLAAACQVLFGRLYLVFAHETGVIDILDLQGHIDNAFRIAGTEVEAIEFFSSEGNERGMLFGEDLHLVVQAIAY